MENRINNLIENYKNGNEESFMEIILAMNPAIRKYAKQLFKMEYEDMHQEMIIALLVATKKIANYNNEFECITDLLNALKYRYFELCKQSKRKENEQHVEDEILFNTIIDTKNPYDNSTFLLDLKKMCIIGNTPVKKKILYFILVDYLKDIEIAQILGVSRQYVNRCKKELFYKLEKY